MNLTNEQICEKYQLDIDTNNKFLVDWFSFSTRICDLKDVFVLLGLDRHSNYFTAAPCGRYFYSKCLYFGGISVLYDPFNPKNMGTVVVEMSGQGCRSFETYSGIDFPELFRRILDNSDYFNITRLDVAYDDFNNFIPLKEFSEQVIHGHFVSKFNSKKCDSRISAKFQGISCELGSMKSDVYFRVYDKAAERCFYDAKDDGFSWTRWEIQMRHEPAFNYVARVIGNGESVGETFKGVLLNYFRVVEPSETDSNKRRWKMSPWFQEFIGNAEKISIFTPCNNEYNLKQCEHYVYEMAGNAVSALIEIKGVERFLEELKRRKSETSFKYKDLINKCTASASASSDSNNCYCSVCGSVMPGDKLLKRTDGTHLCRSCFVSLAGLHAQGVKVCPEDK